MKYEDFEKFIKEKCMYDTIYDDSDGRQVLIIRMLDAYSMVDKALRARLAQPEPDYEAEFIKHWNEGKVRRVFDGKRMVPEREWVGLTREELAEIAEFHFHGALSGREFYDDVETKLKEKNT